MREITGRVETGRGARHTAVHVCDGEFSEDGDLLIAYIGDVEMAPESPSADAPTLKISDLRELFRAHGTSITAAIGGMYTIVVVDKRRRRLFAFQDFTSSPLNFYFFADGSGIYFSTSYKALLSLSGAPRKWNGPALEAFLRDGFIPDNDTLLRGIRKLLPGQFLDTDVRNGMTHVRETARSRPRIGVLRAAITYHDALRTALLKEAARDRHVGMVLSSGYDSNLLLHLLRRATDKRCNLFSIGGVVGRNEIPRAVEIARGYENVVHRTRLVDHRTLSRMPDILWRLEGSVYEQGIFLQYELGRLVSEHGFRSILCGECADQVLSPRFHRPCTSRESPPSWHENQYAVALMLVLKKNGVMCNSFSIVPRYPYLDSRVVDIARALAPLNGDEKRLQKWLVRRRLNSAAVGLIRKRPGTTDLVSLFEGEEELEGLRDRLGRTRWGRHLDAECERLSDGGTEQCIDAYMKVLYVWLFETLIVSGDYDDRFGERGLEVRLGDLLEAVDA